MSSLNITQSLKYLERSKDLIPSSAQTFSKSYTQFSLGVSPIFLKKAEGPYVWDVDGNRFLDLPGALGPMILGHHYPRVTDAVIQQIHEGVAFSLPHYREVELGELLRSIIPYAEMVRFGKNGSDVTAGAVRASRAYTGRERVACCGYHGWQDWFIGTTTRSKGVPKAVQALTHPFSYNDIESLKGLFERYPGEIGTVILEPFGIILPQDDFLKQVVEISHRNGALVIFDECWTGFRLSLSGAYGYFGVEPDMACFGKAIGNGFPISAVVGRKEYMKIFDEIFFSFTFGGDMTGIAAATAVIAELQDRPVLKHVWDLGQTLLDGVRGLILKHHLEKWIQLKGVAPRTIFSFIDSDGHEWLALKSLMQQELHQRGVLFGGYHVVTYSYQDSHIRELLGHYDEIFFSLRSIISEHQVEARLNGSIVQPVFRKP